MRAGEPDGVAWAGPEGWEGNTPGLAADSVSQANESKAGSGRIGWGELMVFQYLVLVGLLGPKANC